MLITIVAGARPNFMKVAPIIRSIRAAQNSGIDIRYRLVHTGQHFDNKMSGDFFEELGIPDPDVNLGCGGGSQAEQTAAVLVGFERELVSNRPNLVIVVGDVNSTMACAISTKKLAIPLAHVEAGIRSGDMTMPEEINRIVTDSICDYFFTTSETANGLLIQQGVDRSKIFFVGNTMIDTLVANRDRFKMPELFKSAGLLKGEYFLLTLHRPANVDDSAKLRGLLNAVIEGARGLPVVFPVHPRTQKAFANFQIDPAGLILAEPFGYLEFMYLLQNSKAVITDSGGITEEATVFNIPCMTLRETTERPETVSQGSNELVGTDPANLAQYFRLLFAGSWKSATVPKFWDGNASARIVDALIGLSASLSVGNSNGKVTGKVQTMV
jgi:UDP-N-acetylglucosamine 2-epimerase (non-hydrolysing)